MANKLEKSIELLIEEAKKFNEALDEVSKTIRSVEASFTLNIPFGTIVYTDNKKNIFHTLAYDRASDSNKFRLLLITQDCNDPKKVLLDKPLIDTDIKTRIEFLKYIPFFVDEYTHHIKQLKKNMEK